MFCFTPVLFSLLWILKSFFFFPCSLRQTATTTVRWRVMSTRTSASAPVLVLSKCARQIFFFFFFGNSNWSLWKTYRRSQKGMIAPFPKVSSKYHVIQNRLGWQSFHSYVKKRTNILGNIELPVKLTEQGPGQTAKFEPRTLLLWGKSADHLFKSS